MRKLLFLLACVLVGMTAQSAKVSEHDALQKARQFLQGRQVSNKGMRRAPQKNANNVGYYVFNVENNGGFVVVAGDSRMRDILGYAEKGSFNPDALPDNIKWLLDYYSHIANVPTDDDQRYNEPSRTSRPEVQPLITTTWDQREPYNAHCPEVSGQLPPTGCVATAMAQVINYFQWPINEVRSMADYVTKTSGINIPGLPARKIGWYSMTDDEIAWLMRYCGQSVTMDYMLDESGALALDIVGALVSVFNYSKTIQFVDRGSYSDTDWEELIYNELNLGRPVIYNGDSGKGTSGHSFILHGYKDGLFYVNWGWSGQCDGYFALTNLAPNDMQNYSQNQNAIIAIQPASNNDDEALETANERTVHLDEAGMLGKLIPQNEWYGRIQKLTISGDINGDDLFAIREMARSGMHTLDMKDARIVEGGFPYYIGYTTENDVIGPESFLGCNSLQTIILPSGITSIGKGAFTDTDLRVFVLPKTITSIGQGIFQGCRNLATIEVEENNPIYYSVPGSNVIIERATQRVVAGCPTSTIPEGVTTIASFALATKILSAQLPESLTTIEDNGFEGAPLKSLYIPKNVKSIGFSAFSPVWMQGIKVDSKNPVYDSRDNCNCLIETATNTVLLGCTGAEIPEGIESIGDYAFCNCDINTIKFPQSLKKIGKYAFQNNHFQYLEIPSGVSSIGESAFIGQVKLHAIKVNAQTPPTVDQSTFDGVPLTAKLIVPNGTKAQYEAADVWKLFSNILEEQEYLALSSLTVNVAVAGSLSTLIPESERANLDKLTLTGTLNGTDFQFIRENLCDGMNGHVRFLDLTKANLENNTLGGEYLKFTNSLMEIKLPATLKCIDGMSFWESSIRELVVPKSVNDIGSNVFYQCRNLMYLSVEKGNTVYDSRDNCNAIIKTATNTLVIGCRSTVVPSSVVALDASSFSGVQGLTQLDLPDGVRSIGDGAFWADEGLTSVILSKSITTLGTGPFVGCSNISSFVIDPKNPVYDTRNNCNGIIETATNTLIQGFGSTRIPEGVVKLAPRAFMYQNLSYLEIPASVTEIGTECFLYCNNLTTVVSHIKKPFPVNPSVFNGDNMRTAVLYVPFGTKNAYSATAGWGSFPKIVEMEPTDVEMGVHAASVVVADFGTQYAGLNGQVEVPVIMLGESVEPITNIDYTITTGSNVYHGNIDIPPLSYMMTSQVLIPFPADATTGEKAKKVTITKVNGQPNESDEKSAKGTLVTVKRKPKFVPLVEEATGTWCGWCPRGAVGLKLLNKTFRDDVVTVAVHSNDPLELPGYELNATGFPSCQINRGEFVDPYYGSGDQPYGVKLNVEAAMRQYTIGEIAVNAEWTDDSQTAIKVNTTTTFVENVKSSPYQIGYLLLEDKQTGTTSDWYQKNYFAGSANNDPNLKTLVDSKERMIGVKYDYVPVATWQHETGVEGSLPSTIYSEEPMSYTYTLDIKDNQRIQDKARLTVVALLLNKDTREVINCAKFKFTPDPDPSVVTVTNYTRTYGDTNPMFDYSVIGGTLEGTPQINCEADANSPVGEYPIIVSQGTVVNEEVTYVGGTLTIEPAPLTISAVNSTKREGDPMPQLSVSYEGFKNGETEAVLTRMPVITCDATSDSGPGEYTISVSSAEAKNYVISYVSGKLVVIENPELGIMDIMATQGVKAVYAPNGKMLDKPQKGVNLLLMKDGTIRKVVVR